MNPFIPILIRWSAPFLLVGLMGLGVAYLSQGSTLTTTQKQLETVQASALECMASVASFEALAAQQLEQLNLKKADIQKLQSRVSQQLQNLRARPLDNTLDAIQQRGVDTAREASQLWNE